MNVSKQWWWVGVVVPITVAAIPLLPSIISDRPPNGHGQLASFLRSVEPIAAEIDEAIEENEYGDIASHALEVRELTQKLNFPVADTLESRLAADVRDAAHELKHAATERHHHETRHAFDSLRSAIEAMKIVVKASS